MSMGFAVGMLIVGFALLLLGGKWLVDGAASLALRNNIPTIVVGLTIVAFGTSAPELFVNVIASVKDSGDIAIGNIIGSNIANILLILGVSALIAPLGIHRNTLFREIPISLIAVLVLAILANDQIFKADARINLAWYDGMILLILFIAFMVYVVRSSKQEDLEDELPDDVKSNGLSAIMIIAGLVGLVFGGRWIVNGAIYIAETAGMSEAFIGLTVVAVGTSLPELATCVIAAMRNQSDLAIGNVVGSNIFNVLWILGVSSTINAIDYSPVQNIDLAVNVIANLLLFVFIYLTKRHELNRWHGVAFLLGYFTYIGFLIYEQKAIL